MVIASLAWSLKVWCGLIIQPTGTATRKEEQAAVKRRIIRMDFRTFRNRILMIPAQIIRQSRRLTYRLLAYRQTVEHLLLIESNVSRPLQI